MKTAAQKMAEKLTLLGYSVDDPWHSKDPLIIVLRKAINAVGIERTTNYLTSGGTRRDKTGKQQEIEAAVSRALCGVLADWPGQPLGMTAHAVQTRINEALTKYGEEE